jgi:TetR/AcrR family transcriptional regulator
MARSAVLRTDAPSRSVPRRDAGSSAKKPAERRPRDAAATSDRILEAAIAEFAEHGYAGARIDAIAQRADANMRMLYHYFGSKNDLYLRVLEAVFERIRLKEQKLKLKSMAPLPAMMKLFDFTYDHFASNPLFIRILTSENLLDGRHLSRSVRVSSLSSPLLVAMKEVLRRGEAEGVFRRGIDPLQIYVSMVAMSYFHISNGPTLSHLFSTNLSAARWRNERRWHASEILRAYLTMEPKPVSA